MAKKTDTSLTPPVRTASVNRDETEPLGRVLLVDDDEMVLKSLSAWIRQIGHPVTACATPEQAIGVLQDGPHSVMVSDLMLKDMDGLELMDRATALRPDLQTVILTSHGSIESAIRAIRGGAFEFLQKPARKETVRNVLRRIREHQERARQVRFLRSELRHSFHTGEAIGKSHQMRHLFELTDLVAASRASVLIHGEHGTGKEVLARLLHARSSRAERAFVIVDLQAGNDESLAAEIFGTRDRPTRTGKLEQADGGTILLREAGRLKPGAQIRLLNFLKDGSLRDGSGQTFARPDVRVVASSSQDLQQLVASGRFREELYYRLAVVNMEVPPLRDRKTDILPLAEHFLSRVLAEHDLDIRGFHRHALALLLEYHWPGNVTELEEAVEQAALACSDQLVMFHHLPVSIRKHFSGTPLDWKRSLKEVERGHILKVLEGVGWNRTRAADVLGIRRMTLYNKIREYKLSPLGPPKERKQKGGQ